MFWYTAKNNKNHVSVQKTKMKQKKMDTPACEYCNTQVIVCVESVHVCEVSVNAYTCKCVLMS